MRNHVPVKKQNPQKPVSARAILRVYYASVGCRVEAVLSVDDRGQMVLPKDVREKAGIRTGDKLALIRLGEEGAICCLALMKAENLSGMVKDVIGPLMNGQD